MICLITFCNEKCAFFSHRIGLRTGWALWRSLVSCHIHSPRTYILGFWMWPKSFAKGETCLRVLVLVFFIILSLKVLPRNPPEYIDSATIPGVFRLWRLRGATRVFLSFCPAIISIKILLIFTLYCKGWKYLPVHVVQFSGLAPTLLHLTLLTIRFNFIDTFRL